MKKLREILANNRKQNDGYLTIEITLVFQVLFFSLMLILFMGMVLYQEVKLQSLAIRASERGSVVYSSRVRDMSSTEKTLEDFKVRDPYRNVPFMDIGKKGEYASLVNKYVADKIGADNIISGKNKNAGAYAQVEDYLIEKRIKVTIQSDYALSVSSIPAMFGHEGPFGVNTTAVSAIVDSPDFVRNVDIVTDIAKQTKLFDTLQDGYGEITKAIQKMTDLIK